MLLILCIESFLSSSLLTNIDYIDIDYNGPGFSDIQMSFVGLFDEK